MARIGCLVILVIAIVAAWLTRDRWLPLLPHEIHSSSAPATTAGTSTWQPLTVQGAARARNALQQLSGSTGPDSVIVTAGDLASYVYQELSRSLPQSADSVQAAAIGDRLYVSAVVKTTDLGGSSALGPLTMLLGDRERVQLGGTIRVIKPGEAELQIKEIRIRNLTIPQTLIPKIVQQMSHGARTRDLSPVGLPLQTPPYIGAVKISDGMITMYRTRTTADIGHRRVPAKRVGETGRTKGPRQDPMSHVPCPMSAV
jgi:hypothetical protein